MNDKTIMTAFSEVNETFPKIGSAGRVMGAFAQISDGLNISNGLGIENTHEAAPAQF